MAKTIENMLVVGTCNIHEDTALWLNGQAGMSQPELIVYLKGEYGWFIPLSPDVPCFDDWKTVPTELGMIITYAMGKGCHWIMLDQAAPAIEGLPAFDW